MMHAKADVNEQASDLPTPLFRAKDPKIAKLLLDWDAEINALDCARSTPLIHMATRGRWDMVKLLLDRKASVVQMNTQGHSALLISAEAGQQDVVRRLIESGAGLEVVGAVQRMSGLTEERVFTTLDKLQLGPKSVVGNDGFTKIWKELQLPEQLGPKFYHALDRNRDGLITFSELLGMGIMMSNNIEDAVDFFFRVYDSDGSG